MKSVNGLAYKSLEASDLSTYGSVAGEYYDEDLHPTCADFRLASNIYLKRFFDELEPGGRIADIGCGRSLVASFRKQNLVLIDESREMLLQNPSMFEARLADIERDAIGTCEFDLIVAVLGDPYNTPAAWDNICRALKTGGECVFIVPSSQWAQNFRRRSMEEKVNLARFVNSKGETVFLRSLIVDPKSQVRMIEDAGLSPVSIEHVSVGELPRVRSPKILEFLSADQYLLDIYRARKI